MEVSSDQDAMPLNSSYGGGHGDGHMIHNNDHHPAAPHNHIIIPSSNGPIIHTTTIDNNSKKHAAARYKECLKNHAASMGGNATDGCGEFLPSGEEGTLESLTCSACHCHRNFHRKEVEGEPAPLPCDSFYHSSHLNNRVGPGRRVILGHHHKNILGSESLGYPSRAAATPHHHHQMIMSYNMQGMGMGSLPSESDEQEEDGHGGGGMVLARPPPHLLLKKRFRTKFTQEQKEKMLNFSEKVGWKIQKQEESVVQQFCQEIGVKRRVLKVWMHNNKHNLAKSNNPSTSA